MMREGKEVRGGQQSKRKVDTELGGKVHREEAKEPEKEG